MGPKDFDRRVIFFIQTYTYIVCQVVGAACVIDMIVFLYLLLFYTGKTDNLGIFSEENMTFEELLKVVLY